MMTLNMNTSYSMALSLGGSCTTAPIPPLRTSSIRRSNSRTINSTRLRMTLSPQVEGREFSLYKGVSDRPLGWKARRQAKPLLGQATRDANVKKWDGKARCTAEWDGLRRDPELWFSEGDCLVHLYGQGQSRRGPAFKVPFELLLNAKCGPLLDRCLAQDSDASSGSESSWYEDADYKHAMSGCYELYIPAPSAVERGQAMLYHIATRNFFAWLLGKSIVGFHLGGALVTLLNSMSDFRAVGVDNGQDILDYMDEEGYADMRNQPDYALAILYFAEHFHFKDVWIDAFAHCVGMNEILYKSTEFEHITRESRDMIRCGRFEMDDRLDRCGKSLSTFLEDELSPAYLGLSVGCRDHLDRFRSFLQAYYVEKLGYYPPTAPKSTTSVFPKDVYESMVTEFQNLYDLLVDEKFTSGDCSPVEAQGGICVLQNIQAFDQRNFYAPLTHPLPLLPEVVHETPKTLSRHFSWVGKPDKLKLDDRLVSLNSLAKASNRRKIELLRCPLVRAYREFEKECIFPNVDVDNDLRLSLSDARKVRWILIYAMLQTLVSATKIPDEVRDIEDVPYHLYVPTAGCPPWQEEDSYDSVLPTQVEPEWEISSRVESSSAVSSPYAESPKTPTAIEPDIDYFTLTRKSSRSNSLSSAAPSPIIPMKSSVRRALMTLGNMPEMYHPRPIRNSYHEILVHSYGNGLNTTTSIPASSSITESSGHRRRTSSESESSSKFSDEPLSPTWSQSDNHTSSPSSIYDSDHRDSDSSLSKITIQDDLLEKPIAVLVKKTSTVYSRIEEDLALHPRPLDLSATERRRNSKKMVKGSAGSVDYEIIDGTSLAGKLCF